MYSPLPYFLYIVVMLCWSEDDEYFDEDFLACETPGHLHVARWCPICCLVLPRLVIRYDVINTSYTVYSTIFALCVKLDPDTHKGIHSVLA
jgi:hypothetical protein